MTTVAAVYALAQIFHGQHLLDGNRFGLRIAALMNTSIVQVRSGESSPALMSAPNENQLTIFKANASSQSSFVRLASSGFAPLG